MRYAFWVVGALLATGPVLFLGFYGYLRSLEAPAYVVVEKDGALELRDYPAMIVAEVVRRGSRDAAVRLGFRPLANYIFAKSRPGPSIAMTVPVTQVRRGEGEWSIRFMMPARYSKDSLPRPSGPDVELEALPPRRMAAIRFGGRAGDADFEARRQRLEAWIATKGLVVTGPPTLAYYDDPSVPAPLRRNEVLLPVTKADS